MRQVGDVTYADAHRHRRNEGVVEFASYSDMKRAIEKLDNTEINGRRIRVVEEKPIRSFSRSRSRSRRRSKSRSPRRNRRSRSGSRRRKSRSPQKRRRSRSAAEPLSLCQTALQECFAQAPLQRVPLQVARNTPQVSQPLPVAQASQPFGQQGP
ncbi:hypothetical protein MRX96_020630 [Rhipicephalus microplus]